ncbi:MAG: dephospho-CoA kinase [bacterium]|nr:dephospho-CoA kinase [bacterium]
MSEVSIIVTGAIGSGKSTVCNYLKEFGAEYISSDEIAKHIINTDDRVRRLLKYFLPDYGSKEFVREIFVDSNKRYVLNSIVHPFVLGYLRGYTSRSDILVIEIPLYVEVRAWDIGNIVVTTYASEEILLERIIRKWHITLEEAKKRLASQLDQEIKLRFANYKIDTSISFEYTKEQTKRVWKDLSTRILSKETQNLT